MDLRRGGWRSAEAPPREPTRPGAAMSMTDARQILVVGAGMGGLRAAEQLRAAGWTGPITVVGAEPYLPYNRPPLSKEVLRSLAPGGLVDDWHGLVAFRRRANTADVEWRLGSRVVASNLTEQWVELADGSRHAWSGLVVATGLRSRRLSPRRPSRGRHALRTLDDAYALRQELRPGTRVVVVGAGFIGCEVAATTHTLGCDVAVVERLSAPLEQAVGREVGEAVRHHHESVGIRFHTDATVAAIEPDDSDSDRVRRVVLDDGTVLDADVLVEAVGSKPATEWLDGNGLDLSDGVLCDAALRVEGHHRVVAVGDVARVPRTRFDGHARRVEHWTNPTDTARVAARTLVDTLAGITTVGHPFTALSSFFSDQGELRLQSFGTTVGSARVVDGDLSRPLDGVVVEYEYSGREAGVLLVNVSPREYRRYRDLVDEATRTDQSAVDNPSPTPIAT